MKPWLKPIPRKECPHATIRKQMLRVDGHPIDGFITVPEWLWKRIIMALPCTTIHPCKTCKLREKARGYYQQRAQRPRIVKPERKAA